MTQWVKLGGAEVLSPGEGWPFETEWGTVAVFNVDGNLYAIDDTCLHMGASLGMGRLAGSIVTCPGHGLTFDVTTGRRVATQLSLRTFSIERRPDGIYIDLDTSEK